MKRDRGRLPAGKKACLAARERMRYSRTMNWHQVIDERSYEMHQVIADVLRRSPGQLALVKTWIDRMLGNPDYSEQNKDALREWQRVIDLQGVRGVLAVLDDRGEEAVRMRQSTPFAVLMPQDKRLEILDKYEARRTRASLAGV
ncbi:MAG: hypothetical protein JNN17_23485 [Verrucomicrobiaceae bacterium]|nr:hypothetical protein [Verrucomicrobiaceae bacterium]